MSAMAQGSTSPRVRTIRVASDFTQTPGGRNHRNGDFNGVEFRTLWLEPALRSIPGDYDKVVVDLDGVDTYIGSFLEEAFGGLMRGVFDHLADASRKLEIKATGEFVVFRDLALQYMREQADKNAARR